MFKNFKLFLCFAMASLFSDVKGWRYPLTSAIRHGLRFKVCRTRVEHLVRGKLERSAFRVVLNKARQPLVLVSSIDEHQVITNVYRVVDPEVCSATTQSLWNVHRGLDGTFPMYYDRGQIANVNRAHQVSNVRYDLAEPLMTFTTPLTRNESEYIQDALTTELPSMNDLVDHAFYPNF